MSTVMNHLSPLYAAAPALKVIGVLVIARVKNTIFPQNKTKNILVLSFAILGITSFIISLNYTLFKIHGGDQKKTRIFRCIG